MSEISELLDQIIQRYKPGGEFGKAELGLLERAKTKSMASGQQSLVSAGLAGTTMGASMGRKWEEEIGMPAKLQLEDIRTGRLTEAMGAKAGYLERSEQTRLGRQHEEYMPAASKPTMASQGRNVFGDLFAGGTQQKTIDQAKYDAARKAAQERHQLLYGVTSNKKVQAADFGKDFGIGGEETTQTVTSSAPKKPEPTPIGLTSQQQFDWRKFGAYIG